MYKKASAQTGETGGGGPGAAGTGEKEEKPREDVVDADFEEVDKDKK